MKKRLFSILSLFLYLCTYLSLNVCNSMHISRMNNDGEVYKNKKKQHLSANNARPNHYDILENILSAIDAFIEAKKGAREANSAMQRMYDITPVKEEAEILNLSEPHKAKLQTITLSGLQSSSIQSNTSKRGTNNDATRTIKLVRLVNVKGMMLEIRNYAYKLCTYALAMKIALERPHLDSKIDSKQGTLAIKIALERSNLVSIKNVIDLAKCIIDYSTVLFDKSDLINLVNYILQRIDPTIDKNFSIHIVEFVQNNADSTIDNVSGGNIIDMFKSILQSASATIDQIDTKYLEIDDVFFNGDGFAFLRDQADAAFSKANEANKKFGHEWDHIIDLNHPWPLAALQKALNQTTEASNAARSAGCAYHDFAKHFKQFIPAIEAMRKRCHALVDVVQPIVGNHTGCLTALDHMVTLLQEALNRLNRAVQTSYKAASLYKNLHNQYKKLVNDMRLLQ